MSFAEELSGRCTKAVGKDRWNKVYLAAVQATSHDSKDELHPIRYAAAVLFDDDTYEVR